MKYILGTEAHVKNPKYTNNIEYRPINADEITKNVLYAATFNLDFISK